MATEDYSTYLGNENTPFELEWARKNVLDYHIRYGMPVIVKRAYNLDHIAYGVGPQGETVERDSTFDPMLNSGLFSATSAIADGNNTTGFGDGWFTYITMGDAPIDAATATKEGAYKIFVTQGEMPWAPLLWHGDLIITLEIDTSTPGTIRILGAGDRFLVQNVKPVTLRGSFEIPLRNREANFIQDKERFIAQKYEAVRMPRYDSIYDIPILG